MIPSDKLALLACPDCRGGIREDLSCVVCGRRFLEDRGVLRLLPKGASAIATRGGVPKPVPEGEDAAGIEYERRRFEDDARGRRRNLRERAAVDGFLGELRPGSRLLDIPCGMGRFADLVAARGHRLVAVDLRLSRVAHVATRVPGLDVLSLQGDAMMLPLRDGSMDAALCVRLLHHLDAAGVRRVLAELARVAPLALVTFYNARTPKYAWKLWRHRRKGKPPKATSFAVSEMAALAREAGLDLVEKRPRFDLVEPCQFLLLRRTAVARP